MRYRRRGLTRQLMARLAITLGTRIGSKTLRAQWDHGVVLGIKLDGLFRVVVAHQQIAIALDQRHHGIVHVECN